MSTTYCVRLYSAPPSTTSALANSGPNMAEYGPMRFLAGWAAVGVFSGGGVPSYNEVTVTFSDPNGQNQVTNSNPIDFRCGIFGAPDMDIAYVGLLDVSAQGAQQSSLRAQAAPLVVIAVPGGRTRVAGGGGFHLAAGALTFQL